MQNTCKHIKYQNLQARLDSYVGWPARFVPKTPEELSKAGFFYIGSADRVTCFKCGITLRDWEADHDPVTEHRRYSEHCQFINTPDLNQLGVATRLVPTLPSYFPRYSEHCQFIRGVEQQATRTHRETGGQGGQADLYIKSGNGLCTNKVLKHPEYQSTEKRLQTFATWPGLLFPKHPAEMAAAGFFYAGKADYVTCYRCGTTQGGWRKGHNPVLEHLKHARNCVEKHQLEQVRDESVKGWPGAGQDSLSHIQGDVESGGFDTSVIRPVPATPITMGIQKEPLNSVDTDDLFEDSQSMNKGLSSAPHELSGAPEDLMSGSDISEKNSDSMSEAFEDLMSEDLMSGKYKQDMTGEPEHFTSEVPEDDTSEDQEEVTSEDPEDVTSEDPEDVTSAVPEDVTSEVPEDVTSDVQKGFTSEDSEDVTSEDPEGVTADDPEDVTSEDPDDPTSVFQQVTDQLKTKFGKYMACFGLQKS